MQRIHYKRFPGDTIVVPMIIGVLLNSIVPSFLQIGSFWTSVVHGTGALVGIFLFFLGASMNIHSAGQAFKKGGVIIVTKIALSILLGFAIAFLFHDSFLGLSSLAVIGGISVANNALYSGIVATMGDDSDKGAVGITSLSVGPTVTMIALSSAGLASVSLGAIIGSILPLVLGMVIGALSPALKKILSAGVTPSIIVVGFALGANMSIAQLFEGGVSGILLGVITTLVIGSVTVLMEKLLCRDGIAAAAISSTAASAVANPQALADVDPKYAAICPIATAQIAASVIVTSFLTPWFTAQIAKMQKKKNTASQEA
ncbi:MAG: 2-keto-3-deoxygluconate permease [Solobacterium sp.]|nr:2-keto-3-deoxygluconate permease [Solobacterium sp.]MCH4206238.1 2-keto-3-deoxygluconate permease [Solobacterium sp.]MCH4283154.1 2-keto-3-deoxygluconate permease [Solobacterium sp.]